MVGVGTNLRPRESTLHSAVERVCPERLMTVLGVLSFFGVGVGVVLRRGPWKVGSGMSKVVRVS